MAEGRPVRSRASERSPRPGAHGVKGKGMLYPTRCRRGANLPFLGREPAGMDEPLVCDAWPVRRQTYGYLPSRRALPPLHRYQSVLLGDGVMAARV